jgi:hypothetical protein
MMGGMMGGKNPYQQYGGSQQQQEQYQQTRPYQKQLYSQYSPYQSSYPIGGQMGAQQMYGFGGEAESHEEMGGMMGQQYGQPQSPQQQQPQNAQQQLFAAQQKSFNQQFAYSPYNAAPFYSAYGGQQAYSPYSSMFAAAGAGYGQQYGQALAQVFGRSPASSLGLWRRW